MLLTLPGAAALRCDDPVLGPVARAESAATTAERILDPATEVFWKLPTDQISLEEVARRSGVTVQTVIRRFGGKNGLFVAVGEREVEKVRRQRDQAPVGDVAGAVRVLVDHYESLGDRCVFAPALGGLSGVERERRLAQLVAVCDVYTWKLLRHEAGLGRCQTERALIELLQPMLEER